MTPVVPSDTEAANKNDRGICYMLELAHDLPCLDLSRTLARSLLGDSRNERFLAVMRRRYGQLRAAFRIGLVLMWITTFVEADIGRVLSVIALPLGAPAVYCSFFMGGIDMLLILVREHEFVYFTVINVLFFVMLALIYGDVRSLDVVFGLVAALLVTMSDALYRTSKSTVRTTIFGLPVMFSIGCMAYLHQIRSANTNLVLLHFGRITMETRDLLLKTCFTMCIFYVRILYRRHVFTHCFKCGTVPCVIHRARLKLVITKAARGRRVTIWSQPKPELLELPHLQHLRLLPMDIIEVEADYIKMASIVPDKVDAMNAGDDGVCYMLELAQELPRLDLSRTLIRSMLGDSRHEHFLAVMRCHYGTMRMGFRIGLTLIWITTFVEASVGCVMGVIAFLIAYEFVFFTFTNVLYCVVFASILGDLRCIEMLYGFVGVQLVVMSDANFRTSKSAVQTTMVSAPFVLSMGCMACLRQIRSAGNSNVLFNYGRIAIEGNDLMLNTSVTTCIFFLRIVYRRRGMLNCYKSGAIPCVIHRARLKLVIPQAARGRRSTIWSQPKVEVPEQPHLQHLRLLPMDIIEVEADNVLWPRMRPSQSLTSTLMSCHRIAGLVAMLLAVSTLILPSKQDLQSDTTARWTNSQILGLTAVPVGALLFSLLYLVPLMFCYQHDLLASLLRKFDVLFTACQFAAAVVSLGDMLLYDYRCWTLAAWFLWNIWILLFDALTPCTRARFGLSRTHVACAIVVKFCCMALIVNVMAFGDPQLLLERKIFTLSVSKTVNVSMHTASFFLNRMLPILIWDIRLLQGLLLGSESELIFIKGSLEYLCPLETLPIDTKGEGTPLRRTLLEAFRRLTRRLKPSTNDVQPISNIGGVG
ncbi:TPA: hypothetical protein N0F65_004955 [Lagenidium giganteum]|uniref:Transmembrane protein n=1 Tax=Lagenidium giganteum TaxID=4803 RepID=A0AAV2YYS5_9STRA|nr:TPA: hypothetical protein N0F65_004955 [Lagenidium giganteum]